MSLFRGIADDMNLQDWLQKFIFTLYISFRILATRMDLTALRS